MINYIFLILGVIIISLSLFFIKKEFKNTISQNHNEDIYYDSNQDSKKDILNSIEAIENIIEELNEYFCNTVINLEEKYNGMEHKINMLINKDLNRNHENLVNINDSQTIPNSTKNNIIDSHVDDKKDYNHNKIKQFQNLKILELKNKGLNIQQIAKELNIGIGEVQLFLNINKK